jgi:hypothetical protein
MITHKFKPYDIVWVTREDYAHYGEVISYPFPESNDKPDEINRIMIRNVPSDSTTLEEVPLSILSLPRGKVKWVQYAEVSGQFEFPIDMLRYESAAPVNFKLAEEFSGGRDRLKIIMKEPKITLPTTDKLIIARGSELKSWKWTTGRWNSFSWRIKPLNTLKYIKGA